MKKVLMMISVTLFMVGCSNTQPKFKLAGQNNKWYDATNENCPNVEFHKDSSITCYDKDMNKLRVVQSVTEDYVRTYRTNLEAQRKVEREFREAERALKQKQFNSNSARI